MTDRARRASRFSFPLLLLLLLAMSGAGLASGAEARPRPPAVEFPAGLDWLNVERPLTLADLQGKVVILDFWTYGCVNCLHVAAELRQLEEKYGSELAIVGVHTPKFDNEKNTETLRSTVVRMDRRHPVVNDVDWRLADAYGMRAWPTLVLIDPKGGVVGRVTGEGNRELLDRHIARLIADNQDLMDPKPLPIVLEKDRLAESLLAGPGKIAVSADRQRVAISDTLHHRVIIADADARIERIVGGGAAGFRDGPPRRAAFSLPQGLAFGSDTLYVADSGNHAVRAVDLATGRVTTLAGTGEIGELREQAFDGRDAGLRSPWALAVKGRWLYIAMAGSHQIWRLDLSGGWLRLYAGTRREGIRDGRLDRATFSQPSGLAISGESLYVADAEASAVRRIDLDQERVETLVGTGLFDFGDRDGDFAQALLQHASGLAVLASDRLVVADTYNHKIRMLDLKQRQVTTLVGTGQPGHRLGTAATSQLNEPGGVAVLGDRILIADTNNHRILSFIPGKDGRVEAWRLREQ